MLENINRIICNVTTYFLFAVEMINGWIPILMHTRMDEEAKEFNRNTTLHIFLSSSMGLYSSILCLFAL
jgi:hypothetical protein